jgi:hypothetical protein
MGPVFRIGAIALSILLVAGLSLGFASTGVVVNDDDNKIAIPDELTMELDVQVAYDDDEIRWRFHWDTDTPGFYHDYVVWQGGEWVRYGRGAPSGDPDLLHEDRLAFLLDDGSVDGFREYGGFITAQATTGMYQTPSEASEEEVRPRSARRRSASTCRSRARSPPTGARVAATTSSRRCSRRATSSTCGTGARIDRTRSASPRTPTCSTRAAATRPSEVSMHSTNWDDDLGQPAFMFDPAVTGQYAMDWDRSGSPRVRPGRVVLPVRDEHRCRSTRITTGRKATPSPVGSWPTPEGRADIFAQGIALDGAWDLELRRALDTGNPTGRQDPVPPRPLRRRLRRPPQRDRGSLALRVLPVLARARTHGADRGRPSSAGSPTGRPSSQPRSPVLPGPDRLGPRDRPSAARRGLRGRGAVGIRAGHSEESSRSTGWRRSSPTRSARNGVHRRGLDLLRDRDDRSGGDAHQTAPTARRLTL